MNRNLYVEKALSFTFLYIKESITTQWWSLVGAGLDITILGDNDFYSQKQNLKGLLPTFENLKSLKKCQFLNCKINQVAKTGLGSSAAMISSLIGSLFKHFQLISSEKVEAIHRLAQFCHCAAQGKIGSGFDISAAMYGSQEYTRFSPHLLSFYLNKEESKTLKSIDVIELLENTRWDHHIKPFQLPKGLNILLIDIECGSSTPKMVSSILKWKQENAERGKFYFIEDFGKKINFFLASALWQALGSFNNEFKNGLIELSNLSEHEAYSNILEKYSCHSVYQVCLMFIEKSKNNNY
jgi:phosphomevalonate kinase